MNPSDPAPPITLWLDPIIMGLLEEMSRAQSISTAELVTRIIRDTLCEEIDAAMTERLTERSELRLLQDSDGEDTRN